MTEIEWVPLAEIARPHGVRGELRLRVFNPESDLLLEQREVQISKKGGERVRMQVRSARRANDAILMQLAGISDRDAAEALRGASVDIPRTAFAALDEGEFYAVDVIGAPAYEGDTVIGEVADYVEYPSVGVFVVKLTAGGTLDVPATEEFVISVEKSPAEDAGARKMRLLLESLL